MNAQEALLDYYAATAEQYDDATLVTTSPSMTTHWHG